MKKKELVRQIADKFGISINRAQVLVEGAFEAIIEALLTEGRVELRSFGVFEVRRRKARTGRNPRTKVPMVVSAKNVVTFQPGKALERQVMAIPPEKIESNRRSRKAVGSPSSNGHTSTAHHAELAEYSTNGFFEVEDVVDAVLNEAVEAEVERDNAAPTPSKPRGLKPR